MEFNFKKDNDDGIKRVIGKNLTVHRESADNQPNEKTAFEKQNGFKKEQVKTDIIAYIKNLNLVPFLLFLIFAAVVIMNRNSLTPSITPQYTTPITKIEENTVSEKPTQKAVNEQTTISKKEEQEEKANTIQERDNVQHKVNSESKQVQGSDANVKQGLNSDIRPELNEIVNPKPKTTTPVKKDAVSNNNVPKKKELTLDEKIDNYKLDAFAKIKSNYRPTSGSSETIISYIDIYGTNSASLNLIQLGSDSDMRELSDALMASKPFAEFPEGYDGRVIRFKINANGRGISIAEAIQRHN